MILDYKPVSVSSWSINPVLVRVPAEANRPTEYESAGFSIQIGAQDPLPAATFTRERALEFAHSIIKAVA